MCQLQQHNIYAHVVPLQILHVAVFTELLRAFLWDIYNTAEVPQVESVMNNGDADVLCICCVDTDSVAALLMGQRLSWEVTFVTLIFINQ